MLAGLFVAVAVYRLGGSTLGARGRLVAAFAASALALELVDLAGRASLPHGVRPSVLELAFELVLLVIALGFPVASWAVVRERAMLADRLLGDQRVVGLDGLGILLADTLGDPYLRIHRWDAGNHGYVGPDGSPVELEVAAAGHVDDGGDRLAALSHGQTTAMDDPMIVAAVVEAVRLTARNERWQAAQRAQLAELEAARGRLIDATDRQRAATAARLRDEVVRPIEAAASEVRRIDLPPADENAREALDVAGRELHASAAEILALIAGVPPATLGDGGLAGAIARLAERCPLPVSVTTAPDAIADPHRETALFYVCSEALANAIKHARANRISIDLRRDRGDLVITIVDDGIGGAHLSGFGLRGLADRLAAYGGRLRVDSPPGAGTTLRATIPPS